ncbi:hypothetical protein GSbR_30470 [Geobacter sp. SVR]|nr:hypothetical protein GSbR_30470 [Geobacter sp. SVR]
MDVEATRRKKLEPTRRKLEGSGRNIAGWARSKGFDPERMRNVFRGRFQIKPEEEDALKADGLYVEGGPSKERRSSERRQSA